MATAATKSSCWHVRYLLFVVAAALAFLTATSGTAAFVPTAGGERKATTTRHKVFLLPTLGRRDAPFNELLLPRSSKYGLCRCKTQKSEKTNGFSVTALHQQLPRPPSHRSHNNDINVAGIPGATRTELGAASVAAPESSSHFGRRRRPFFEAVRDTIRNYFAHRLRRDEAARWQAAFFAFISSLFIFRKAIDAKLVLLWNHLMTSQSIAGRVFRSDSWEWGLAVACFVVWIHGFWYADRAVRKATEQGKVHPWRKFRLQDRFEADRHRRSAVAVSSRAPVVAAQAAPSISSGDNAETTQHESQPPATKQSVWNWQGWTFEIWVSCIVVWSADINQK